MRRLASCAVMSGGEAACGAGSAACCAWRRRSSIATRALSCFRFARPAADTDGNRHRRTARKENCRPRRINAQKCAGGGSGRRQTALTVPENSRDPNPKDLFLTVQAGHEAIVCVRHH